MKYINYFFALYFLVYGLLMAFQLVSINYFTIGVMAVVSAFSFIQQNLKY